MPKYIFECSECLNVDEKVMGIGDFLKFRSSDRICEICKSGKMHQQLHGAHSKIERSRDEVKRQIREDVKKTIAKINSGDAATIANVYGDRKNPHKY